MIIPNSNRCPSPNMIAFKSLPSPDVPNGHGAVFDMSLGHVTQHASRRGQQKHNNNFSTAISMPSSPSTKVKLIWKNLSYQVPCKYDPQDNESTSSSTKSGSSWFKFVRRSSSLSAGDSSQGEHFKEILKNQSGHLTGGTLTALMGPSGAGKSTLLNCITNRIQEGVSGDVWVKLPSFRSHSQSSVQVTVSSGIQNNHFFSNRSTSSINTSSSTSSTNVSSNYHNHHHEEMIRIAFVPQSDHLFSQFTVRESLMFASRLNNSKLTCKEEHRQKVNSVLDGLDLDRCADLKVSQLSGGQIKRVSIGVELISNPEILILDEPTSGLDSDNSENVVRLLKNLTISAANPPAIISTIHQPSFEVFNMFDQVYLLNKHGENVYFGSPTDMISYLCSFGFQEPSNVNPADYAIEIANGRFGTKQFEPMACMSRSRFLEYNKDCEHLTDTDQSNIVRIENLKRKEATGFCFQFYMIFMRSMQAYLLKSPQTLIKTIMNILIAALVCSMWAEPLGPEPGCWSTNLDMSNATSETEALKNSILEAAASEAARENYLDRISKITGNVNFIFMAGLYYIIVYTVGTVLIMPLEMRTVTKELSNSWYNVSAYFTAKTTCDIILLVMTATIALVYNYFMTGQPAVPWRFAMFYLIIVIFCEVCESKGVLIGVVFNFDSIVATIVATTSIFPDVIFSGFMIKIAQIPFHYKFLTTLSHLRYSFEATLLTIYGFGRCSGGAAVKDFVDDLSHAQKSPLSLISTIWSGLNITVADTRRFAILLGLEEQQLQPVVTAISDYLGPNYGVAGTDSDYEGETTTLSSLDSSVKEDKPYEASYVLSYFNIHDRELVYDVGVLLFMVFLLRLLTFIALSYKTKRQRL